MHRTGPLLNKEVECLDQPRLFNGVHVPAIDFSVNHFIGISEYWYSTQDVWSLGGMYDFVEFEKNAIKYCGREWADIMQDHRKGGGGWREEVELSRLETQCFKAAWIINILHEGIGIPRIIDSGGKGDGEKGKVVGGELAEEKGWTETVKPVDKGRKPSFQSVNKVGEVSVSWTLGKMVLEVSRGAGGGSDLIVPAPSNSNSWSNRLPNTISDLTSPSPVLFLPFFALAALVVYFFFKSSASSSSGRFQRRNGFDAVPTDDPSSSDSTSTSSTSRQNRRASNGLAKFVAPFRWSLFRLSSILRSWSKPRPTTLLPMTRTNTRPTEILQILRPRPRLPSSAPGSFLRSTSSSAPSSSSSTIPSVWNDVLPRCARRLGSTRNDRDTRSIVVLHRWAGQSLHVLHDTDIDSCVHVEADNTEIGSGQWRVEEAGEESRGQLWGKGGSWDWEPVYAEWDIVGGRR